MEPRTLVVVERLTHERGQQTVPSGHLLDQVLEAEGAVGGVEREGMAEVDLVLAAAILVGGRYRAKSELHGGVEHARERAWRGDRGTRARTQRPRCGAGRRS